jgi:hypothetical protein
MVFGVLSPHVSKFADKTSTVLRLSIVYKSQKYLNVERWTPKFSGTSKATRDFLFVSNFRTANATRGSQRKYPEDFGLQPNASLENAAYMLFRAIQTSQNQPYTWTFIDKP